MENLSIGFLLLVIIIIIIIFVAKLHSDLNKIAEEVKSLRGRDYTNERRCRISYSFLLDGGIAMSSFVTTLPPKIENDVDFFDTIRLKVVKDIEDSNLDVGSYENIAILGWSFYD